MLKENLKDGLKGGIVPLILLGILVAYLLLGDTGLDYRYSLDEDLHNQVEVFNENGEKYLTYQGNKYIFVGDPNAFSVYQYRDTLDGHIYPYKDDILLSWNGTRWSLWYITEYYSYSLNNPLFIYNNFREVFLHEAFDYTSEAYVTLEEGYRFVFCDELTLLDSIPFSYSPSMTYMRNTNVTLCSESNERIQIHGRLFRYDSVWYFGIDGQRVLFQASDEFVRGVSNWPDV